MPEDPLGSFVNHDVEGDVLQADDERRDLHDPNDPDDPLGGPETLDTSLDDLASAPAPSQELPEGDTAAPAATAPSDEEETPAGDAQPAVSAEDARRWAGRFETPEQLEQAYATDRTHMLQAAERANAAERRLSEVETAIQRYLEHQKTQQQAVPAQPAPQPVPEPSDAELVNLGFESREQYRAVANRLQQELDQRYAPVIQQMTAAQRQMAERMQADEQARSQQSAEAQAQQARAEVSQAITSFRTAHPEFAPGTDQERSLADTIQRFNLAWTGDPSGQREGGFEVGSVEALEIAAEAMASPALARVLEVNPHYFDTEAGMELARHQASLMQASTRAATSQPAGTRTAPASPHVESGATGTIPGSSGASRDEFDAVLELDHAMRSRLGSS